MASAYTPGLQVARNTRLSRIRELPILGQALVKVGDTVQPSDPVLSASLAGEIDIIRAADRMGFEPDEVIENLLIKEGDQINEGQLIAEIRTFFGLFRSELRSNTTGTVEFITQTNAHIGVRRAPIPLSVPAYIHGVITEVVPEKSVTVSTQAALIQGIFGVGGERIGIIRSLGGLTNELITPEQLQNLNIDLKNAILIGGAQFSLAALNFASAQGAVAIVTGSVDANLLRDYVGHDISVSITGDEDIPCTLIVTEGFGFLPMSIKIDQLAQELTGRSASVNGATQVRAGAMRPEIIVSHNQQDATVEQTQESDCAMSLDIGSRIRIIRVPHFGAFANVTELPTQPEQVPSGATVRVLRAKLDSGEFITVPRANVELVAE